MVESQLDVEKLNALFTSDSELVHKIIGLADLIIAKHSLRFHSSELLPAYELLFTENILEKHDVPTGQLDTHVKGDHRLLQAVFRQFTSTRPFNLSLNVEAMLEFIEDFGNHFKSDKINWGIYEFSKDMLKHLCLLKDHLQKNIVFDFARSYSFSPRTHTVNQFFYTCIEMLAEATLTADELWPILWHLSEVQGGRKTDVIADGGWETVQNCILGYCKHNTPEIAKLIELLKQKESSNIKNDVGFAILLGAVQTNVLDQENLLELLQDESLQEAVQTVFINLSTIDASIVLPLAKFAETAEITETKNRVLDLLLVKLIIQSDEALEAKELSEHIFKEHIFSGKEFLIQRCFQAITAFSTPLPFFWNLVISDQIQTTLPADLYVQLIAHYFWKCQNIERFFEFVQWYAPRAKSRFSTDPFQAVLSVYRMGDTALFDQHLARLLIADEGAARIAGQEILYYNKSIHQRINWSFDVLNYDHLSQYKFVIAVLTPYKQIQETIPLVLPLLASQSEVIKELVICKLEELIQSFDGSVVLEVQDLIPDSASYKTNVMLRLNATLDQQHAMMDKKVPIKELDPNLTQATAHRRFFQHYQRNRTDLKNSAKPPANSILSLAKTITVSRGGGFIRPGQSGVQPLSRVSVSYTLPRIMFIKPELEDHYLNEFLNENWSEIPWEQIKSL